MKKIICILTSTRAEYGLLRPLIKRLRNCEELDVRLVVTGAHLSPEFGLTYQEIEHDRIPIDRKIEILLSSDTQVAISKSMGLACMGFAEYFSDLNPDFLLVLGDRYETLAVCCAAANQRIPIVHLHGGEATEGAIDESFRHAITKLSFLHFTSTEKYRNRVIQLGEHPERVYNVGALGVENVLQNTLLEKHELEKELGILLANKYVLVTYHPVTLEKADTAKQFQRLLNVLGKQTDLQIVFTKANADVEGRIINKMIKDFVDQHKTAIFFSSLGTRNYLSMAKHSAVVIGNSSSGIIEIPSLNTPTINIGDRQRGRVQSKSVINCNLIEEEIEKALEYALSDNCKTLLKNNINPYGDGNASQKIAEILKTFVNDELIELKKEFFDFDNILRAESSLKGKE